MLSTHLWFRASRAPEEASIQARHHVFRDTTDLGAIGRRL